MVYNSYSSHVIETGFICLKYMIFCHRVDHLIFFLCCIFCLSSFCVLCPMLPISLDCPFLRSPSVFSNFYLFCLSSFFALCPMLPMSLDCPLSTCEHPQFVGVGQCFCVVLCVFALPVCFVCPMSCVFLSLDSRVSVLACHGFL